MIWDPCLARAVAAELGARLEGSRARALSFRREDLEVLVHFRDATLVVDLSPGRGVIILEPPTEPDEDAEPLPAVLVGVKAVSDERVIVMRFRRVRGRKPHPGLILELATNRWNAILAEGPEMRVRKRLRVIRSRPLPVGQPWSPPGSRQPAAERELVDFEGWSALVGEAGVWGNPQQAAEVTARSVLLSRVAYLSGLNIGDILDASDPKEGFRRWRTMAEGARARPHLLRLRSGMQPYPWPLSGVETEPVASLIDGMARVRDAAGAGPDPVRGHIARRLAAEARRLERKLKHLSRQLEKSANAGALREEGGLILSSLHVIEAGATRVTLTGFDGEERTLTLDPLLRPQEHANALFRRAARMERAAAGLPERIRSAREALDRITALQARHARGDLTAKDAEQLLPPPHAHGPKSSRSRSGPTSLPYRVYTSSGGLQIRVGRGARHNDELTFHHSRPTDIWLHARHAAGAHVILRWTSPERPPATDLEEAAVLAANHSGARGAGHVPVDWTWRKWVRKPRGAARGVVTPDRVRTLFVSPDPLLGERLGG